MTRTRKADAAPMTLERAALLLGEWHGLAIRPSSATVAAADFSRVNRLAGAAADAHYSFWDNPSDLRTLLEGGE